LHSQERYTQKILNYQQPVLIYNPTAGKFQRSPERILQRTTDALKRAGLQPELLPTKAVGDATLLAQDAISRGADLVLVLGGDGTINEVANGVIPSKVPLGVMPAGTANVLAMELGLGSRLERAIERLGDCVERRISVGRVIGNQASRYFLMMGGVGLDATIVTRVNPLWKARTGKLAYWAAGFQSFFERVGQFEVCVDNHRRESGFVLAARVRNYGGDLEIAGGASLLRDDFEIVTFEGSNPLRYAAYFSALAPRMVQKLPGVYTLNATRVQFSGTAHVQIDGEYAGQTPLGFEIVPEELTLLMPVSYR
jgi:diacylglycerol kinase (ATP)